MTSSRALAGVTSRAGRWQGLEHQSSKVKQAAGGGEPEP